MPTVSVNRDDLFAKLGQSYTEDEFQDLCFDFGLELDEVTSEKEMIEREQGRERAVEASESVIFKIDVPANRYDLLCIEGLSQGLLIFLKKISSPKFRKIEPLSGQLQRLIITSATAEVRPHAVAAVLRGITFTAERYASFIDLQDKLHQNICRRRTLVAIGTHDLDSVQGPFVYDAQPPSQIKFKPLNQSREFTAEELMSYYQNDLHLKQYLHIIRDEPLYPVIRDQNGVVLSMPPIINGERSRIKLSTRNVLVECTATDLHKARVVLDTLVCMFSGHCDRPFAVEPVRVELADSSVVTYPTLAYREETVNVDYVNRLVGVELSAPEMASLLTKMGLCSRPADGGADVLVQVPPTRHDVMHPCDVAEDVAIAFGYNNIAKCSPPTNCNGQQLAVNRLTDLMRQELAASGFTEALTFVLCSKDDVSTKLGVDFESCNAVVIANPKSSEFQVGRSCLLPGLLKTLACNKSLPRPLKLFEISDVILKDENKDVGACNRRYLCAVYFGQTPAFELMHGLLDRTMQLMNIKPSKEFDGYQLQPLPSCATFFSGHAGQIRAKGRLVGQIGVLHPNVLSQFDLNMPCSMLQLDLQAIM